MAATIGVLCVVEDQAFYAERYFREILTIAGQAVVAHDHRIRILPPLPQDAGSAAVVSHPAARGIDAALVVAPDEEFLDRLAEFLRGMPAIVISAPRLDLPYSYVNSDNYGALRQLVSHLARLGRRRIRLLQPFNPTGDFLERERGYMSMTAELGLEPLIGPLTLPLDRAALDAQVLVGAPDALIAPDDHVALALLSRLQRRGVRVPDDVALVGFDDEDFAADTFPALTTVSQPLAEMARRAATYLIDCLAGVERDVYQDVLPNVLVVRESCGTRSVH